MKALVIDDDRVLADLVAFTLRRQGFQVALAYDGETALARWRAARPDVVVLDVNLPGMDGFTVCRRIRAEADTPIIMLTVRDEEDDVVRGLELGADDYVQKPFSPRQLVARVEAVLRRAGKAMTPSVRQVGELTFDPGRRQVRIGQKRVSLTPLESRLMDCLVSNVGHIVTSESIIDRVWGPEGGDSDMLRQLIHRLRGKIEPDPSRPTYVETVPGLGYGLTLPRES